MSAADAADRAEVLASFQACTGIDDVGVALEFLEESNWNLLTAVHRVVPENSQTLPSERYKPVEIDPETIDFGKGDKMNNRKTSSTNDFPASPTSPTSNHLNSDQGFPQNSRSLQTVPNTTSSSAAAQSAPADNDRKVADMDSDSDVEDLTYQDDEFLLPETNGTTKSHQRFLITDNVEDEMTGTILFTESFENRYGHCHPMFFHGSLEAAVKEATIRPAKERKLLAIYLHHDDSVLSNIFCTQVLCTEAVVNLLSHEFVVWGWDVTHESNRQLLLAATNKSFGPPGVSTIRQIDKDRYPVIIVVSRVRATTEICDIIYGSNGVDEIMVRFLHILDVYKNQQAADVREEEEREARERVIQEQNEAYQESLRADMAKEEAKKAQELQKKRDEQEKLAAIALADAQRRSVSETLPAEPGPSCTAPICTLRARLPNGKIVSRKFLRSTPLRVLFDYLFSEGYSKDDYKVLFSHPKRDLTEHHKDDELIGDVFQAQDTIILEER